MAGAVPFKKWENLQPAASLFSSLAQILVYRLKLGAAVAQLWIEREKLPGSLPGL